MSSSESDFSLHLFTDQIPSGSYANIILTHCPKEDDNPRSFLNISQYEGQPGKRTRTRTIYFHQEEIGQFIKELLRIYTLVEGRPTYHKLLEWLEGES